MRTIISVLIAFFSWNLIAAPLPGSFQPTNFEFKDAYQFGAKELTFAFTNTSADAIDVSRIESARPNVELDYSPSHVEPGGTLHVKAKILSFDRAGKSTYHFDIYTGSSEIPDTRFASRGFVDWIVDPNTLKIDFEIVVAREGKQIEVPIASRSGEDMRLVSIEKSGKFTKAEILDEGRKIRFTTKENLDWGLVFDQITFRTNNKVQPRVEYAISADVRGEVVPSSNPLDIGMIRANKGFDAKLTLEGPVGKKLKLGTLSLPGTNIVVAADVCVPKVDSCAIVRLSLPPQPEKTRRIQGVLEIELPDYGRMLPVPVNVFVVKTDTVVRNLNEDAAKAEEAPSSISSIMKIAAIAPTEMTRPGGIGPLLTWQVGNEWGVYGYELYRSESEHGEFKRVNDVILKALVGGSPKVGSIYHWRDLTTKAEKNYWYYIQIVYDSGQKQPLSDPQMVRTK